MYVRSIQNIVLLHIHETNPYLMTPPSTIPILKKQERQSWLFWLFLQEIFIFLKSTQNNFPTKSQCWLKWLLHSNPRVLSLFTPVSYVPIDLYNSAFRFNHLNSLPISPAEKSSRYSHSPQLSLPFKNIHKQNWYNWCKKSLFLIYTVSSVSIHNGISVPHGVPSKTGTGRFAVHWGRACNEGRE